MGTIGRGQIKNGYNRQRANMQQPPQKKKKKTRSMGVCCKGRFFFFFKCFYSLHTLLCVCVVLEVKPRALHIRGKYSTSALFFFFFLRQLCHPAGFECLILPLCLCLPSSWDYRLTCRLSLASNRQK
jgi:hypothetical protein